MKTVLLLAIGVLASIGLGYILAALQRWLLRPRHPSRAAAVLPVFPGEEDIEQRLRSAYTDLLSGGYGEPPLLLVTDFGADVQTLKICRAFCEDCSFAQMCSGDELGEALRGLQPAKPGL